MSDVGFIDAEMGYANDKNPLNFQFIILTHLKKITDLCCSEWHGGYWKKELKQVGGAGFVVENYIQNTRDCFWNAVYCLYDITFPYFDEEMNSTDESINKELEELNPNNFKIKGAYE